MVGRKKEIEELKRIYNSNRAQLVAVYGRRRVGKTYLVDEAFKGLITFRHAGLSPFTLRECEQYFDSEGRKLSRYDITQAYMVTGGIPYYLSYFKKGKSLPQNIDELFFAKNAKLKNEFERLFFSIFNRPEMMISIIKLLSNRNAGYTRSEIASAIGCASGGTFSQALNALIESDFIVKYVPFGYSKRMEHYKLVDTFCMFYIKFVEKKSKLNETFWQYNQVAQSVVSWRGFAFESVCFNHISQIKQALGIGGVSATYSAWSKREDDAEGTQVDLIIERKDNVVNMCEIKFYGNDFSVNKDYHKILINRQELLSKELSPKVIIHNTLITTYGLKYNEYSKIKNSHER